MTSKPKYVRGEEPDPCLINHYTGHHGSINCLKFHPLTTHVFTGSADGYIMKWDFSPSTAITNRAVRFDSNCGSVKDLCLSKSGDLMVSVHKECHVKVWVPTTTGDCMSFKGHNGCVRSVCFSPTYESIIATAGDDKTVKIWNILCKKTRAKDVKIKTYDFIQSFTSHTNWVRSVRFAKEGNLLCSASDDNTVRLFDTRTPKVVQTMKCPEGTPTYADFNPCSSGYVGASLNNSGFLMFDTRQLEVVQVYKQLTTSLSSNNSFAFHPSGDFAVCVFQDSVVKILDLVEGRPIFTLYGSKKSLKTVDFNVNGNLFATGGEDKQVLIWKASLLPHDTAPSSEVEENSTTISTILESSRGSQQAYSGEYSTSPQSQWPYGTTSSSFTSESEEGKSKDSTEFTGSNEEAELDY